MSIDQNVKLHVNSRRNDLISGSTFPHLKIPQIAAVVQSVTGFQGRLCLTDALLKTGRQCLILSL